MVPTLIILALLVTFVGVWCTVRLDRYLARRAAIVRLYLGEPSERIQAEYGCRSCIFVEFRIVRPCVVDCVSLTIRERKYLVTAPQQVRDSSASLVRVDDQPPVVESPAGRMVTLTFAINRVLFTETFTLGSGGNE
jgi:hypothetical protein